MPTPPSTPTLPGGGSAPKGPALNHLKLAQTEYQGGKSTLCSGCRRKCKWGKNLKLKNPLGY